MRKLLLIGTIYGLSLIIFPDMLMSVDTTSKAFAADEISSHGDKISAFLFGPVGKIAAILGGGYGLLTAYASGSAKPLIGFGAIGLMGAVIPTFVSKIYTALLP